MIESTAQTFDDALNLFDFEALAHKCMSPVAWEYISSGAADEITVRWNRAAFDRIRLKPRTLVLVPYADNFTWKDIEWLRSIFHGPVLLKGILNPDDADEAEHCHNLCNRTQRLIVSVREVSSHHCGRGSSERGW